MFLPTLLESIFFVLKVEATLLTKITFDENNILTGHTNNY